ncbi:unnamed protein product [Rhizophagus irregularis]|uniref:Uncharacterized protein n=1 Tax=Rhizophagus irregularis TaxID=588596 RepID=A0A916E680_9GLOM|nr:unnamed protein product [Rhizophagus irregularis]CAB5362378.1 unnamed protein product [Rhizophagus irregularis]
MMSTQAIPAKPTYREIESALIAVIKAGILYKKPKDGKFMLCYKQRIIKLRQAEEPENFVLETAQSILPNETKLYYELAKDYFLTDSQADDEVEDYLNS